MNNKALTEGAPWKGILSFMIPVLLGLLLQQLYNTVDTIIVGNFAGESPLAAVGAVFSQWHFWRWQMVFRREPAY